MINVLVTAIHPQRFLDQVRFAKNLRRGTDRLNINFFINDKVYSVYGDVVDELEFEVVNKPKIELTQSAENDFKKYLENLIKKSTSIKFRKNIHNHIKALKSTFIFTLKLKKQEKKILEDLQNKYDEIYKIVKEFKIQVLLVNGDRHLGYEPVFLKISKELKIPSVIIFLVSHALEEDMFYADVVTKKIKPNVLTSRYIKHSQDFLKYKVVRESYYYPHPTGNALAKFGVLTPNPYVMGSGYSDVLCLNNQHYKNMYVTRGVDEEKIRVVGDGAYDDIYNKYLQRDEIKRVIYENYSLDFFKKLIIIALPQLGEHNIVPWKEHWEEIGFLMKILKDLNENILISLHPKMDRNSYDFLEEKYNCFILDERLADVLPIADLFVATFSSTVIWSVLCGVKTVVADFHGKNNDIFDFLVSIKKVERRESLHTILKYTLHHDIDFSEDWRSLSRHAVFDGKTIERYAELICELGK